MMTQSKDHIIQYKLLKIQDFSNLHNLQISKYSESFYLRLFILEIHPTRITSCIYLLFSQTVTGE